MKTSFEQELDYFSSLLPHDKGSLEQKISWSSALASAILGVEDYWEIIGGLALHILAWKGGGQGPSVVYNYLSGVRLHRGDVRYAYLPMVVNTKDLFQMPNKHLTHIAHAVALVIGYISSDLHKRTQRKKAKNSRAK